MLAYNVDEQDLHAAATEAGVVLTSQAERWGRPVRVGRGLRFTLLPQGKRYQRRGFTGRRINAVCWHGHYAFMAALFERVPKTRLVSAAARYENKEDFDTFADRTGDRNIGSEYRPLAYRDACDCEGREAQEPTANERLFECGQPASKHTVGGKGKE